MRRQTRTMALARRQRPPEPWLPWIVFMIALALAALGEANAQTTAPPPPMPPKTQPTGPTVPPPAGTGAMQRGVVRPPGPVDPAINKGVPDPQAFPTPVIPPPGTPGGNPRVEPK